MKRKLQVAENKTIRFITQLGPRTRITPDISTGLNLFNVEDQVKQLRVKHADEIFYNLCHIYLKENFTPLTEVHQFTQGVFVLNFITLCQNNDNLIITQLKIGILSLIG